jgi:hypothetical protein
MLFLNAMSTFRSQIDQNEEIQKRVEVLKKSQNQSQGDVFLDVHDIQSMLAQNEALSWLFSHFTGRELLIDDSQNIELDLDIGLENDREFVQSLQDVKLPDLKSLKIINFME